MPELCPEKREKKNRWLWQKKAPGKADPNAGKEQMLAGDRCKIKNEEKFMVEFVFLQGKYGIIIYK